MFANSKIDVIDKVTKKYCCRSGDEVQVLTQDAGAWCGTVIVINHENDMRFHIRWDNLEITDDSIFIFSK